MPGKTVTVDELADYFRVTPETVRAGVRDRRITPPDAPGFVFCQRFRLAHRLANADGQGD